jgi:hypothetical protein
MIERLPLNRRQAAIVLLLVLLTAGIGVAATVEWSVDPGISFAIEDGDGNVVGPEVNTDGSEPLNITTSDVRGGPDTIDLGTVSFTSADASSVTVSNSDIHGDTITARQIDTGSETLYINASAHHRVGLDGSITEISFQQIDLDDSTTTEMEISGSGTVSVGGFENADYVRIKDGSGGELVAVDSNDRISFSASNEDLTFVEVSEPQLTASPTGNPLLDKDPVELSVDLTHADFSAGTTVDIEFRVNGEVQDTITANSNGTYSVNTSNIYAGTNAWSVTATDSEGGSTTLNQSDGLEFRVTDEIQIRDETNPSKLIDAQNVTLEFYFDDGRDRIEQRETTNGIVDMNGLPATEPFIVVANAEGYHPRRIFVENLTAQQTVYLLNESADTVQPEFEVVDFTGRYPSENTILEVQRNINGSWRTVQGDYFGAAGSFRTTLLFNQEHRLRLYNVETGQSRQIGRYTPTRDALETIEITAEDSVVLEQGAPLITASPSTRSFVAQESQLLSMDIRAGDSELEEITMSITYTNGSQTEELANTTRTDGDNIHIERELDLTNRGDGHLEIDVDWRTVDGESGTRSYEYSIREVLDKEFGLLATLASIPQRLGGNTTNSTGADGSGGASGILVFASILMTVMGTASATSKLRLSTEAAGMVALLLLAAFWTIGWLPGSVVFAAVVTFATLAAARRQL